MKRILVLHDDIYVFIIIDGKLVMNFEEGREANIIKKCMQISRDFIDYEIEEVDCLFASHYEKHELFNKYV